LTLSNCANTHIPERFWSISDARLCLVLASRQPPEIFASFLEHRRKRELRDLQSLPASFTVDVRGHCGMANANHSHQQLLPANSQKDHEDSPLPAGGMRDFALQKAR
jgi:hypothetical protein